jgi:hypothetical protein
MESIYSLQQRADTLRQKTLVDSISPEEVGSLHADTLAYLADMEQNAEGLGIHKVYKSFAAMNADSSAPVGTNGKPLRFGQLVAVYDKDNQSQAENGNIYAFQKGAEAGWLLMGNLNSIGELDKKLNRNLLAIEFDDETGNLNAIIGQDSTISSVSTDEDGNVIIEQEII